MALVAIVASVLLGAILAHTAPSAFEAYVTEDGPIEWLSVAVLLAGACVCAWRLRHAPRTVPALLLVMFLFAAGEEISWGQRLLGIESPAFFRDHNAQRETNVHNLVVNGVKLNKLVFSWVVGVVAAVYWFVLPFLSRRRAGLRRWGIPVPRPAHSAAFLIAVVLVQLTPHERRWELLEWALVSVFLVAVVRPAPA